MKYLVFFVLILCAVDCDDSSNNYYVIEIPDEDPPVREVKKPFRVYWNVPTMQCKSKKVLFENLYQKYGIIQNKNDSFLGERIAILYDPGLFPALLKNETSGKIKFRNGGVPQEGDLEEHLHAFRSVIDKSVPDRDFTGIGIIDFESWRPVFRQNFGILVPYKDVSYEIERKMHWWWPKAWIEAEAKKRFEESARRFMQTTLSLAKQMRPYGLWGYYAFPYCFNMANKHMKEWCADNVPQENDQSYWLWAESKALYPSIYSSRDLSSSQLAALIRGRVKEASRVRRNGTPILPYFWFRYREGGFLNEMDLKTVLQTLYQSNASGFVIWGSSNDVNTVDKCIKLLNYVDNVMGPAIAKYTKHITKIEDELFAGMQDIDVNNYTNAPTATYTLQPILNKTYESITTTDREITTTDNDIENILDDPEFHWNPPENYTQDIVQYVEDEIIRKSGYNFTLNKKIKPTVLQRLNESILIDVLLKILSQSDITDSYLSKDEIISYVKNKPRLENVTTSDIATTDITTEILERYDLYVETSTSLITHSNTNQPYTTNTKEVTSIYNEFSTSNEYKDIMDIFSETEETTTENNEIINSTTNFTENYDFFNIKDDFYNEDTLFIPEEDYTTSNYGDSTEPLRLNDDVFNTLISVETENENRSFPKTIANEQNSTESLTTTEPYSTNIDVEIEINADITELTSSSTDINKENTEKNLNNKNENKGIEAVPYSSQSLTLTGSTDAQVSSGHSALGHKYFICIFIYFYSVSKCLCDIYGRCS